MVFRVIHVKDSLLPMGKVWSLDFLGFMVSILKYTSPMDCIGKGICHSNKKNLKSGLEISKSFAETDQLFMVQKSGEPVDMVFISHDLQGFIHFWGGWPWGLFPSTV